MSEYSLLFVVFILAALLKLPGALVGLPPRHAGRPAAHGQYDIGEASAGSVYVAAFAGEIGTAMTIKSAGLPLCFGCCVLTATLQISLRHSGRIVRRAIRSECPFAWGKPRPAWCPKNARRGNLLG